MSLKSGIYPDKYQKMVWVLNPKDERKCRLERRGQFPQPVDYYTCVKSHLPKIFKAKIKLNSDHNPEEIDFVTEKQHAGAGGFQHPCSGDSGAGHWIQKDGKAILVGIHIHSTKNKCGDSSHMLITTDSIVMRFIRGFAEFGDLSRRIIL